LALLGSIVVAGTTQCLSDTRALIILMHYRQQLLSSIGTHEVGVLLVDMREAAKIWMLTSGLGEGACH